MSAFDLVLRGGTAVLPGLGRQRCDVAVSGGRFAAILAPGAGAARETLEITGLVALPGAVDVHLHLGHGADIARPLVPGDAAQETAAAVAGGITCIMPYLMATDPFETLFTEVCDVTAAGARMDFGYHFIISTEAQLASVGRYAGTEFGAPSVQDIHEQPRGRGRAAGVAGHR